jgi:hypothetical protein
MKMEARNIPPVNKPLCRGGAALASVTAVFLVSGNAAIWLVPQRFAEAARSASNPWAQEIS